MIMIMIMIMITITTNYVIYYNRIRNWPQP